MSTPSRPSPPSMYRQRLSRWLPWVPSIRAVQDERDFLHTVNRWWDACEQFHWLLFTRDTYSYLGMVGAHDVRWDVGVAELGYWLTGESEGNGYMCEAVAAVHAQLFRMGFYRVEIRCAEDNARSAGVPKRLGYRQDGRLRGDRVDGGRRGATLVFSLLADDK